MKQNQEIDSNKIFNAAEIVYYYLILNHTQSLQKKILELYIKINK